jgi:hypothetical protein
MSSTDVNVKGFTFKQQAVKKVAQPVHIIQVLPGKKEDQAGLPKDNLFSLQETLTKSQSKKKFTILPLALDHQEKLEDTFNLAVLPRTTRTHLTKFDLSDVFNVFKIDDQD